MGAITIERIALVVSVAAFGLSGFTLYRTEFRGPDISLAVGHDVLITKTTSLGPRVGVICSFSNEGARQTIITNATLDLDSPSITLPLGYFAESFGAWEESGGVFKTVSTRYNLAAPIPVKGHDRAAAVFWFVPVASFELTPGQHRFTLTVISQDGTWKRNFVLDISPTDIGNIGKSPYADHTIAVLRQN